jgi:hypothetical protein
MAILAGGAWTAWRMSQPKNSDDKKNNNDHKDRPKAGGA